MLLARRIAVCGMRSALLFVSALSLCLPCGVGGHPVVAYLFTLRRSENPMLRRVWESFWRSCPAGADFHVHTHTDPTMSKPVHPATDNRTRVVRGFAGSSIQDSVHIRRFEYSMVRARLLLLRRALAVEGPVPDFFIFFSETDAPISSCTRLLTFLESRMGGSFVKVDSVFGELSQVIDRGGAEWTEKYAKLCPRCRAAGLEPTDYRHGPGWVGLFRDHAAQISQDEKVHEQAHIALHTYISELYCCCACAFLSKPHTLTQTLSVSLPYTQVFEHWRGPGVPDEAYWTTLMQKYRQRSWGHLLTYMLPGDARTGHPHMFGADDVPALESLSRPGKSAEHYYFVRKMNVTGTLLQVWRRAGILAFSCKLHSWCCCAPQVESALLQLIKIVSTRQNSSPSIGRNPRIQP